MIRLLRLLVPASVLAMFFCEAALITASFLAGVYLDPELRPNDFLFTASGWLSVVLAAALVVLGMHFRQMYSELRIRSRILLLQELFVVFGAMLIVEALLKYFDSSWALPRRVLLQGSGLALAGLFAWRILLGKTVRDRLGLQRVLFVGFTPAVAEIAEFLERQRDAGYLPVGYLVPAAAAAAATRLERLGSPQELREAIERHRPEWIVVGRRDGVSASQVEDLISLRFNGVRVEDIETFYERAMGRANIAGLRRSQAKFPEGLLPNPYNLRVQSIYATLAILVALPVAIPLLAVIAIAIRIGGRRPVLVRQTCIGLGGAPFNRYRFRSLDSGRLADRFLHRLGLYHLPEIWNVLRGEMSLVGPEADRPEFADRLNQMLPCHQWRLLIPPGMIGWAQNHERTQGTADNAIRRLEYDLYYLKHLSPVLDLFVVVQWLRMIFPFHHDD